MAQSDVRLTGDQVIAGSIQHSFMELVYKIFSMIILSLLLIQEGQLSVSGERMCINTG